MIYIELYYGLQIFRHYKLICCKISKKKGILQEKNLLFFMKDKNKVSALKIRRKSK